MNSSNTMAREWEWKWKDRTVMNNSIKKKDSKMNSIRMINNNKRSSDVD